MGCEVLESMRTQLAKVAASGDAALANMIAETLELHVTRCHICLRDEHN